MWSEEEVREVAEPVKTGGVRSRAQPLRWELTARNLTTIAPHVLTRSSVIYTPGEGGHGNFLPRTYRRILARPEWAQRLKKAHTGRRPGKDESRRWCELDAATSSDALLMNVFCTPGVLASARLAAFLGVERGVEPVFGFHPRVPLLRGLRDTTEIDMKLGDLLVEAKLTEGGFERAAWRKVERYKDLDVVFDRPELAGDGNCVEGYQLVRGVLAAYALRASYCLLVDGRRMDLVEPWYGVVRAVRAAELRARLRVLTWQEVAACAPRALRRFLEGKYGIVAA